MSSKRTLASGILSPFLAAVLGAVTYSRLTGASSNPDADFVFRLSMTALAMTVPFWITLFLARGERRRAAFGTPGRVGLGLALLSLGLVWLPVKGALLRSKQARALALAGVEAPLFESVDIAGNTHRLSDHRGKVVLVNIWATWCAPCKKEMSDLDRLYLERRDRGLMVFGLSTEDRALQQKYAKDVLAVSYPLLTLEGQVPEIYRTTARYPANFLVDRNGRLHPAPSADQPFEKLLVKVEELLAAGQ